MNHCKLTCANNLQPLMSSHPHNPPSQIGINLVIGRDIISAKWMCRNSLISVLGRIAGRDGAGLRLRLSAAG